MGDEKTVPSPITLKTRVIGESLCLGEASTLPVLRPINGLGGVWYGSGDNVDTPNALLAS
jgi:hypothetical protein